MAHSKKSSWICGVQDLARLFLPFILALAVVSTTRAQDEAPPELLAFDISPTEVDVTSNPSSIDVSISVADVLHTLNSISASFDSPSAYGRIYVYFSVPNLTHNYSGIETVPIQKGIESGTYSLHELSINVELDNYDSDTYRYYPSDLDTLGFPYTFDVISQEDLIPPTLTAFTFLESEVDVRSGPDSIAVSFTIEDDQSGLNEFYMRFVSPSFSSIPYSPQIASISSYDLSDWIPGQLSYSDTAYLVIDQYWESGDWQFEYGYINDLMFNYNSFEAGDLGTMGFASSFTVISEDDSLPPVLTNFELSPLDQEVSGSFYDTVEVNLSATDNLTGLKYIQAIFNGPMGEAGVYIGFEYYNGDQLNYSGTSLILLGGDYFETGTYTLDYISLRDMLENERLYHRSDLVELGFPTEFTWGYSGSVTHVSATGDDAGDGSLENPFVTIQKAINSTSQGDTVLIQSGVYRGPGNRDIRLAFNGGYHPKQLVILSEKGPDSTIIDCESEGVGFSFSDNSQNQVHDRNTVIDGLTILNGYTLGSGAGMQFSGAQSPTINNCIIENGSAEYAGGGMLFWGPATPLITNCIIKESNAGVYGGAVWGVYGASPIFFNTSFIGNTAGSQGGGAYFNGSPIFIKALIANNFAPSYGGLYFQSYKPVIENSTITSNSSTSGAGGIYAFWSSIRLSNSIVWGNSTVQIDASSSTISYSDVMGGEAGVQGEVDWLSGNINANPLFIGPEADNYGLQVESPALNAGNPSTWYNDPDGTTNDMGFTGGSFIPSFTSYDFSEIGISETGNNYRDVEWEIWNTTGTSTEILSASFSTTHFSLLEADIPLTIPPFSAQTFNIRFLPLTTGTLMDSLVFQISGSGNRTVAFQGTGINNTTLFGSLKGILTKSDSPYQILDDIEVLRGDSLTIEAGVELRFCGPYKFNIRGLLRAVGTEQDSIIFTRHTASDSSKWGGIRFRGADDGSELAFCRVEYAKADESGDGSDVRGGGVYVGATALTISNCEISNNESRFGGGLAISGGGGETIIANCFIMDNTGESGGGINLINTAPTILNTSILRNAAGYGAGIYLDNSSPDIQNCIIMGNVASTGGGIYLVEDNENLSMPSLKNCLIARNMANSRASAVYCSGDSTATIFANCTIAENRFTWDDEGSAIYSIFGANILLVNSILSNHTPNEIFSVEDYPVNVTIASSTIVGGEAVITGNTSGVNWLSGNLDMDPLFANSELVNYGLATNSPAIDAGVAVFEWNGPRIVNYSVDQYIGAAPDMGAYEMTFMYPGDTDNNGVVDAFDVLPLGIYFLEPTLRRSSQDLTWTPKSVASDSAQFARSLADVNGDGLVSEQDVIGIGVNWGNTHDNGVSKYVIDPENAELIKTHEQSFTRIFQALSGQGEASRAMRSLLRSLLKIEIPDAYSLAPNYPNPFNPMTTIPFDLPEESDYSITIFDILGRRIWSHGEAKMPAGSYTVQWDGLSDQGKQVPSGVYLISFSASDFRAVQKAVLIR